MKALLIALGCVALVATYAWQRKHQKNKKEATREAQKETHGEERQQVPESTIEPITKAPIEPIVEVEEEPNEDTKVYEKKEDFNQPSEPITFKEASVLKSSSHSTQSVKFKRGKRVYFTEPDKKLVEKAKNESQSSLLTLKETSDHYAQILDIERTNRISEVLEKLSTLSISKEMIENSSLFDITLKVRELNEVMKFKLEAHLKKMNHAIKKCANNKLIIFAPLLGEHLVEVKEAAFTICYEPMHIRQAQYRIQAAYSKFTKNGLDRLGELTEHFIDVLYDTLVLNNDLTNLWQVIPSHTLRAPDVNVIGKIIEGENISAYNERYIEKYGLSAFEQLKVEDKNKYLKNYVGIDSVFKEKGKKVA